MAPMTTGTTYAQAGAGAGGLACASIAVLALFKGERHITRTDWAAFAAALSALPLWYVTHDALWAVIWISVIDVLGFYPTLRKSYRRPHEELIFTHLTSGIKHVLSLFALEAWLMTTWLYPSVIAAANLALVAVIVRRRKQV